jgi:hypothetical protein
MRARPSPVSRSCRCATAPACASPPDEWNPGTLDLGQLSSWTRVLVRGRPVIPPPIFAGSRKWEAGAFQLIELAP